MFIKLHITVLAAIFTLQLAPQPAQADDVYQIIVKKQEQKKKTRWSLSDWLETRDRMRMMDLWLALHAPSPYEFFIGGDYNVAEPELGARRKFGRAYAAAYASIFGLEFEKSFSPQDEMSGIFNLRAFGYHAQGTNLTLQGGVRATRAALDTRNAFAGASLTVYLGKYFGLEGLYRHHFSSVPRDGLRLSGSQYSGGAFLDFRFLRVYGDYLERKDKLEGDVGGGETRETGFVIGTKLFF